MRRTSVFVSMLLVSATCAADDAPVAATVAKVERAQEQPHAQGQPTDAPEGDKKLSGMSILGNQEAPKALVIVPWKSSAIGDTLGLNDNLDDSRRPVDKEVFMRELRYYEIRSGKE
jgi:hypothetical protein